MAKMKPQDYVRDYGYQWGAPSAEARTIDKKVCAESKCGECGHGRLNYEGIHKGGSYKAFSLCPECGDVQEF